MIHKIKALHDNSNGLPIRAISQQLGLSRNTVRKYLRMGEVEISERLEGCSRTSLLDQHRSYIRYLLETCPRLSEVKVARKLCQKVGDLAVSERAGHEAAAGHRPGALLLDMVPSAQRPVPGVKSIRGSCATS